MYARGCIVGVTRGTTRAHIARAVLEAIAFEVTDLMNAMRQDAGCEITVLRVDGGASVSDVMLRFQSDLLRIPVDRPKMVETTAFGAAALAGLAVGFWQSTDEVRALRVSDRVFSPERAGSKRHEMCRTLWITDTKYLHSRAFLRLQARGCARIIGATGKPRIIERRRRSWHFLRI